MRLVYIVGMGRSGSTLLDLLLDAHSGIRSLGGVRRLPRAVARDSRCACGNDSMRACGFWTAIDAELRDRLGIGLADLDVDARDAATFRAHNTALFEAAARVAGTDCIVDSSKSVGRLQRLLALTELDVRPIHIDRDPRGYTYSQRKRKHERLLPAFSYVGRSLRAYWLLRDRPHAMLGYARLATDTETCLRELMPRLDLRFEPAQLDWAAAEHHNIGGGVVLRKTTGNTIRLDTTWRHRLPTPTQTLIQTLTWPGRMANQAKARRWGVDGG